MALIILALWESHTFEKNAEIWKGLSFSYVSYFDRSAGTKKVVSSFAATAHFSLKHVCKTDGLRRK